jgi:NADH-quinone oxidoreductase subunit C
VTSAAPVGPLVAAVPGLVVRAGFDQPSLLVPPDRWRVAVRTCRDEASLDLAMLDMLTGVDLAPGLAVVAHLFSPARRHHVLLETRLDAAEPTLDSVADIYPSAGWHERETFEMFGVRFAGHPDLRPLLTGDRAGGPAGGHDSEETTMRKADLLPDRARGWPGAAEPGGVPSRRPQTPYGAPPAPAR